jgi:DNA invertase Pin-like site-specific DNA recombinase
LFKKQDVANQLCELRAYCKRIGYEIYHEYIDNESGAKGRRERKAFGRLFDDASQKKSQSL